MTLPTRSTITSLGWYLDTSTFHDFVDRNIRIGFDNAEHHDGSTILHITGNKSGVYVPVIRQGKRYAFLLTQTVNHLRILQMAYNLNFYYSELTRAEVYRSLRKAHGERSKTEITDWWGAFQFLMNNYQKTELDFGIDHELPNLALDFPIRKNIQDYIHLIIAKKNGLAFITSDKLDDQIEDLKATFYQHIYFWPELKNQIAVPEEFKILLD